jgi:hypothetical protein
MGATLFALMEAVGRKKNRLTFSRVKKEWICGIENLGCRKEYVKVRRKKRVALFLSDLIESAVISISLISLF